MYLLFDEYQSMGGKLKEAEFKRLEIAACTKIDSMTYNRLQGENPVREKVKYLVFELIERNYLGSIDGRDTVSESVGRTSFSFESRQGKANQLIRDYLDNEKDSRGVPLFYAGNI